MRIPKCFPDELIFSRIIRHFIQSGMSSTNYLNFFFETRKISFHPLMTCNIGSISQYTNDDVEKIFYNQTLSPLFLTFMPGQASNLKKEMIYGESSKALRICQFHKFSKNTGISLKYCSLCARDDIEQYGVPYWHREHQIFGICSCSKHGIILERKSLAERQRLNDSLLPSCNGNVICSSNIEKNFSLFSKKILDHFSNTRSKLDLSVFKSELYKKGYISKHGRVRRKKLINDFFNFYIQLSSSYVSENKLDTKYFSFLLSGTVNQHPFKYISLGFWLFENLEGLLAATQYRKKQQVKKIKTYMAPKPERNIEHSGSALKITRSIKVKIYTLAARGFHRSAIAERFNISIGSVEHEISQHTGLVDYRKRCKFESRRRRYRLKILRFQQLYPDALRKDVRKANDSAFIWLYHNDKIWFEKALPKAVRFTPKGRVDWEKRDRELVVKVVELMKIHKGRLTRSKIDKLLGGHGWMIKQKKKLPQTMKTYTDLKNQLHNS